MGDMGLKSPPTIANGFMPDSKSPYHMRDNRSPFKEDGHLFKFEDRITGESLIPKGDPMEARLQEILRRVFYFLILHPHIFCGIL